MPELHTERSSEQGCAGGPRVACERESTRRSAKRGESGRWSCQARPRSAQGGGRRRTRARRARGAARGELRALLHENTHRLSGFTSSPHIHCFVPPGVCGMCGWWAKRAGKEGLLSCLLLSDRSGGRKKRDPNMVGLPSCLLLLTPLQFAGRAAQHGGRQHTCAGPPSAVPFPHIFAAAPRTTRDAMPGYAAALPQPARAWRTLRAAAVGAQPVARPAAAPPKALAPRRCPRQTTPLR